MNALNLVRFIIQWMLKMAVMILRPESILDVIAEWTPNIAKPSKEDRLPTSFYSTGV